MVPEREAFARRSEALALDARRPDGVAYRSLPEDGGAVLAREFGLALREVQARCLDAGIVPERYARNLTTHSLSEQARLLRSRVVVVGLGGLGGHVLEILCRMGVGRISAADGDLFEQSNLNRQLLSSSLTLERTKATAALERARLINPAVELLADGVFWDFEDMETVLAGADLAVDAMGGLDDRPALQRAAAGAGVPLVTAAIAGMSGYVATVLPGQVGPATLFGTGAAAEDSLGSPAPSVAVAASLQCAEALGILCGWAPTLAGKMLIFDLADMTFETMQIA
ncbi:MAG: ThiF family adenylyltransferase [Proteobacteria bacterium]|nr:ThiF family adenylyltransferase [Pseudomonadota bacterium]